MLIMNKKPVSAAALAAATAKWAAAMARDPARAAEYAEWAARAAEAARKDWIKEIPEDDCA